ncbi:Xaa-Pro peptidase family protein [Ferrovibrio sp. MS7]|uniref:M24 family metallopeptidase n=1 Tax=Ferrovibrio plantarum TaxID=3119164 RepID=UPI00313492DD
MAVTRLYPAIPESDYLERRSRLQRCLTALDLRGALLLNRANIAWLTGFRPSIIAPNMAFVAAYLPVSGEAQLIGMPGLANLMRECAWGDVTTVDSATAGIATLLQLAGPSGRIGMEGSMGLHRAADAAELAAIEQGIGSTRLTDISPQLWDCRILKTAWELAQYRRLGAITALGFRAGLAMIAPGVSEQEVARAMWGAMIAAGADAGPNGGQIMVRSGPDRYPVFCGPPTTRRVQTGEQMMLAGGPVLNGYHIDIHRFANIGPVSDLQARLYAQSRRGIDAALAAIRPGVTTGAIYDAAATAMRENAATEAIAWRVFGHGIGLENYEYPMIAAGGDVVLREGIALAIEIPAYDVPQFRVQGAFLEECVLVTADGAENLTSGVPRDLHVVM